MGDTTLDTRDIIDIFSHQKLGGPFSALAVETGALNYLDRLNRQRLNVLADSADRTAALHKVVALEQKLYQYVMDETPLSLYDIDFREKTAAYIRLREIFLLATDFTFKRHRFQFLLDLLRLYEDDSCNILPERDIEKAKWEHILIYDYLLLDMGQKNTEDIGREAVSNGYHECDYTLEIEEVWKQPAKAIPRDHFRYVKASLDISNTARAMVHWMAAHTQEMKDARWSVDVAAIEELAKTPQAEPTDEEIKTIEAMYKI